MSEFTKLQDFARRLIAAGISMPQVCMGPGWEDVMDGNTLSCLAARLSEATFGEGFQGCHWSPSQWRQMEEERVALIKAKIPALKEMWGDDDSWAKIFALMIQQQPVPWTLFREELAC